MKRSARALFVAATLSILSPREARSQACAAHVSGGVSVAVVNDNEVSTFNLAATPQELLVSWSSNTPDGAAQVAYAAMQRRFTAATLAPIADARELYRGDLENQLMGPWSVGGASPQSLYCRCPRTSQPTTPIGCFSHGATASAPTPLGAQGFDGAVNNGCSSDRLVGAINGSDVILAAQSEAGAFWLRGTSLRSRMSFASGLDDVNGLAMTSLDANRALLVYTASTDGVRAAVLRSDGQPHSSSFQVSAGGAETSSPSVFRQGNGAMIAFAQRPSTSGRSVVRTAQWDGAGTPTIATVATGSADATSPSLAASTQSGCAILSWTEGRGRGTTVRVGRVCNGALDRATTAQLSRPRAQATGSTLASDGTNLYALWLETRGRMRELRLARLGCR